MLLTLRAAMQHFGLVLNFLRDGECDLPSDPRERKELLREAEHYEVKPGLLPTRARLCLMSLAVFWSCHWLLADTSKLWLLAVDAPQVHGSTRSVSEPSPWHLLSLRTALAVHE